MARKILGQQVPPFFNQYVSHLYTRLSTGPLRMPRSGSSENALPMEEEKKDEGLTLGRRQRASAPPADDEAHETDILSMDNASKRTKTAWEPAELWQLCRAYLCSLPLDQDVLGTVPNTSVGWNSLMARFAETSRGTLRNTLAIRQLLTRKITGGTVRPRTLLANAALEYGTKYVSERIALIDKWIAPNGAFARFSQRRTTVQRALRTRFNSQTLKSASATALSAVLKATTKGGGVVDGDDAVQQSS